eukprot:2239698-Rhodomonas_salina.1
MLCRYALRQYRTPRSTIRELSTAHCVAPYASSYLTSWGDRPGLLLLRKAQAASSNRMPPQHADWSAQRSRKKEGEEEEKKDKRGKEDGARRRGRVGVK